MWNVTIAETGETMVLEHARYQMMPGPTGAMRQVPVFDLPYAHTVTSVEHGGLLDVIVTRDPFGQRP